MFNKKYYLILLILTLLIVPIVLAQNEPANVVLTFVDAVSKEPISDVYVNTNSGGEITTYFLEKDQTLKLNLNPGEYRFTVLINNPTTKGYDYYGETFLPVEKNLIKVVYLYPVGSLNGFVKDKLDTTIVNADLMFDCSKALNIGYPPTTDRFGSFSLDYVPVGTCKIFGSYQDSLGVDEIEIKQGEKNFIDVKLDAILIPPKQGNNFVFSFGVLVVILLIIGLLVYYFTKKINLIEKKEKKEEQKIKILNNEIKEVKNLKDLGKRAQDVFKTLRDNEKKIVEFLILQKESVYFSKIHFKTGLSKGSLFRNLQSLERKNIVVTSKEGRVRNVKLSEWFLEK